MNTGDEDIDQFQTDGANPQIGVVVIGRNEGKRLHDCLRSVAGHGVTIVYVDSGSTDGSVDAARKLGARVVALDMSEPFTAARARNAGVDALLNTSDIDYVQFVDGDCTVVDGWLDSARTFLDATPRAGVVSGQLLSLIHI